MSEKATVVVNSTDSFEDCWVPFFTLFKAYWSDCPYPIVLNTETKHYKHHEMNIRCTQVSQHWNIDSRIPWSDSLIACLQSIYTDYILYLQDDYFLYGPVDGIQIDKFFDLMRENNLAHINAMYFDRRGVNKTTKFHPLLWEIKQNSNYRISMQAGLWNRQILLDYLVSGETGWQFERKGTQRAHRKKDVFLCQSLDYFNKQNRFVFPYEATGIVKGKWLKKAVVDLFDKHQIQMDFEKRGFFEPGKLKGLMIPIRAFLRRIYMYCSTWEPE